jgi:hypothetical protein
MYVTGPNRFALMRALAIRSALLRRVRLDWCPTQTWYQCGVAILGDKVFMVTDTHLIALNRTTGRLYGKR